MLPVLVGTARTHRRILLYTLVLVAASIIPGLALGAGYAVAVGVLGAVYLGLAWWARAQATSRAAALLFHYSLLYLALVFVAGAAAASW